MSEGFTLIDAELGWPDPGGRLWDVVQVSFGHQTDWRLQIELEREGRSVWIAFADPVSHRVQDEGEMLSYWTARAAEGVEVGTFYTIAHSAYLDQISEGVSGTRGPLHHYLVAGLNLCVEVIARTPPDRLLAGGLDLGTPTPA